MKKIIYSLVIMIAAGSLFTSCIEQVEPLGIQDMRFAKAEYIRALKDLRAADAELVRAQAAHEQARARYVDAMTANLNADTEYQKLLNEYRQLLNEARQDTNDFISQQTANKIDSIKKRMELRELEHAKDMADAKKALAEAEELLRVALRNIELSAQDLTKNEKDAVIAAVKAYKYAFEQTANQRITVLKKQRELDSLKLYSQIGDTVYDKGSKAYIGQVEKYKKDIERNEIKQIALAALLLAVPDSLDYEDVNAWQEQLEQLSADSAAVAYEQYQDKIEMANYYTTYIHDGVAYFDTVAAVWQREHKAVAEPEKPTKDEYTGTYADSLKYVMKRGDIRKSSWDKFVYLLNSYNGVVFPASKKSPKNTIFTYSTTKDTVTVIADHWLKDYVMGAAGNGKQSQKAPAHYDSLKTADFGLEGVYDILARELVITEHTTATPEQIAAKQKQVREADSVWSAHRQILIDGLDKYVPFNQAESKLATEEEKNGQGAAKMVQAIKDLKAAIAATYTKFTSFDGNDSTKLFEAMVNFATAREEYLDYTAPKKIDVSDPAKRDSTVFYFSDGKSGAGKAILNSKKFSALTETELKALKYELLAIDPGDKWFVDTLSGVGTVTKADSTVNAFAHIMNQLGSELVTMFDFSADTIVAPTVDATYPLSTALYNTYKVDSWSNPTKIQKKDGSAYEPKDLKAAKGAIVTKINEYIKAYNDFWNLSVKSADTTDATATATTELKEYFAAMDGGNATTIATKRTALINAVETACSKTKYNPECYTKATFKPYEDDAPIVKLVSGHIVATDAVSAVLVSVDPNTPAGAAQNFWSEVVESPNADTCAIFNFNGTKGTDFYNFIARYNEYFNLIDDKASTDLADIRKLVDAVAKKFADDEANYGKFDEAGYNEAVAIYEGKLPAYNAYQTALKEFTGVDKDGKANGIVTFDNPAMTANDFTKIEEVLIGNAVEGLTPFGYYPGEWNKKLGGEQLELAKTLFPDYPEKIAEWYADMKIAADELVHYQTLIKAAKDAYIAAATVAEENVGGATTWDQLIANYTAANKAYRKRLADEIEALQTEIDTWTQSLAQFEAGKPAREIAIAEKAKELAVETAKLQNYEEALAYAKANLDRILEYVKSLDSNFVIPSSPDMYPNNYSIW